jgi:hypothetical protein
MGDGHCDLEWGSDGHSGIFSGGGSKSASSLSKSLSLVGRKAGVLAAISVLVQAPSRAQMDTKGHPLAPPRVAPSRHLFLKGGIQTDTLLSPSQEVPNIVMAHPKDLRPRDGT